MEQNVICRISSAECGIETISDEKEKADDAIRLLKAKLQNTLSKFETVGICQHRFRVL
jgi:hypothetical protein